MYVRVAKLALGLMLFESRERKKMIVDQWWSGPVVDGPHSSTCVAAGWLADGDKLPVACCGVIAEFGHVFFMQKLSPFFESFSRLTFLGGALMPQG